MRNDLINGFFECFAGLFLIFNVMRVYKDKRLQGVSMISMAFFLSWGFWNLYYYPSLGQWASFWGGILVVAVNSVWVGMALYYTYLRRGLICDVC